MKDWGMIYNIEVVKNNYGFSIRSCIGVSFIEFSLSPTRDVFRYMETQYNESSLFTFEDIPLGSFALKISESPGRNGTAQPRRGKKKYAMGSSLSLC